MGPQWAAEQFLARCPQAQMFRVTLYSSLAATGRGHMTDAAILQALAPRPVEIAWLPEESLPLHPNGMRFEGLSAAGAVLDSWEVYSVGGGALMDALYPQAHSAVYDLDSMRAILKYCTQKGLSFWEYVEMREGPEIWDYLRRVWAAMQDSVQRGLRTEGALPGGLGVARKAWALHRKMTMMGQNFLKEGYLPAYALAVAEENAAGGVIVTAPTCGSSGVLPAVLYHLAESLHLHEESLLRDLATAGLVGNLIKHNASISGARVGCQGEIGAACAMAAAAATQLMGGTLRQIEYAAEMGLEHHLGLTCDPVDGLVQIPCI